MTISVRGLLAGVAGVTGLLAMLVGRPAPGGETDRRIARLAHAVSQEEDHITALELAGWIHDHKSGLRLLDLQSPSDFSSYHLPGSRNVTLESLTTVSFTPNDTVVLVSRGGTHAAQGWVFLEIRGCTKVYFLRGGIEEWIDDIMRPVLPAAGSPGEAAAVARHSTLSRYFGGVPHPEAFDRSRPATSPASPSPESAGSNTSGETARWRRGC